MKMVIMKQIFKNFLNVFHQYIKKCLKKRIVSMKRKNKNNRKNDYLTIILFLIFEDKIRGNNVYFHC